MATAPTIAPANALQIEPFIRHDGTETAKNFGVKLSQTQRLFLALETRAKDRNNKRGSLVLHRFSFLPHCHSRLGEIQWAARSGGIIGNYQMPHGHHLVNFTVKRKGIHGDRRRHTLPYEFVLRRKN